MDIVSTFSYRHAEAILKHEFPEEMSEIKRIIAAVEWVPMPAPKERTRKGKTVAILYIDQSETNVRFDEAFKNEGWEYHPLIVSSSKSHLVADFKKGSIQVEVQFGNMARWYTDIFKFLLSYAADDIEIGVLIVPMQITAKQIDENVVYFERVVRELPHAKMAVTIPVWVVGVNGGVAPKVAAELVEAEGEEAEEIEADDSPERS